MPTLTLDLLPEPSGSNVGVHITRDALRHIRAGHPWIWDGSIERISGTGQLGDLAVVFDEKRKFAAIGLYDPESPIVVRLLHHGSPRSIDDHFFADRVTDAIAKRQRIADNDQTSAWRLIHGENDQLPGLVVDRYATTLVVRLDTLAWLPHLRSIVDALTQIEEPTSIVLRTSRQISASLPPGLSSGTTLVGPAPVAPIEFVENGLLFEADVIKGQKTGHFLDQRDNRQLVASRCHGATVLDVFCNTGGFTVHAAAAGARRVTSVDISEHAIDATRRHVELNRDETAATEHSYITADAFDAMERLANEGARFDVVIVDPPSFAPNAAALAGARRAYRRLTSLAIELLGSGGTLFQASCSSRIDNIEFHDLVADEIDRAGFVAANAIRTEHCLDHPIGFAQGAYLKALLADLQPR